MNKENLIRAIEKYYQMLDTEQPIVPADCENLSSYLKELRDDNSITFVQRVESIDKARAALREFKAILKETTPRKFELYEIIRLHLAFFLRELKKIG